MRVPLSWLKEYVDITLSVPELKERLTLAGLEVTGVEEIGKSWARDKVFVAQVLKVEQHPNADRLVLATVDYGGEKPLRVVTGAPNLYPYVGKDLGDGGPKVAFALVGARLIDGYSEKYREVTLKPSKIRGILSEGMVLSEKELGLSDDHTGIIILPDDAPVGTPLADYLGDTIFEIDLTPNLGRCLSMIGVAREVAALTGTTYRVPESIVPEGALPAATELAKVDIEDPDLCNRYTAMIIRGVETAPSPFWMQQRLRRAGMRPINNIVDITNYVMLEWGQPLHAFDYDKLAARADGGVPHIIVRRARDGERMRTLDGVDRTFTRDDLLITDEKGPIAIAGVMGGEETEIDESTVNILLESASFDPISIRRTSTRLKLPSEASYRFARVVPPELNHRGARRAVSLMAKLASGDVAPGMVDAYPVKQEQPVVEITAAEVNRLLGTSMTTDEVAESLERLEFDIERKGELLRVAAPWYRRDVEIPADVVEEVARIVGYDRIPETLMSDELPPQRRNVQLEGEDMIRDILVGSGMQEIITYPLIGSDTNSKLLAATGGEGFTEPRPDAEYEIPAILPPEASVRLANPLSREHDTMRSTLIPSMLITLAYNLRFADRLAMFEVGRAYWPVDGEKLPREPRLLSLGMIGPVRESWWQEKKVKEADFFALKGVLEALFDRLGIADDVRFEPLSNPVFHPGRAAEVFRGKQRLGVVGEVHPLVREAFDLPSQRVVVAELDLVPLAEAAMHPTELKPISQFPAVKEDLAVVVDADIPAARVAEEIRKGGGRLLQDVRLFDVYTGKPIPPGKVSLAFSLTYQDFSKTLSDKDVAKARRKIIDRLQKRLGAELRG